MKRVTILLAGALAAAAALAQQSGGGDPTRPPAALSAPSGAPGAAAAPGQPHLQSILVSTRPGGRRLALIDGKNVREGQRVGGAVVVAIRPAEVVLRRGGRTQVLKLFRPAQRSAAVQP